MKNGQGQCCIIINPAAGRVKGRNTAILERIIRDRMPEAEIQFSRYRGDTISLVDDAVRRGVSRFGIVGGDGSLNEAINGMLLSDPDRKGFVLAVLPWGSGNDWARVLGFADDPEDFVSKLCSQTTRPVDVARILYQSPEGPKTRYFLNVAGLAYDASIAEIVNGKIYRFPKWVYLYEAVRQLFSYRAPNVLVESDGYRFEGDAFTVNIGVQPYSGGGMQLVPHARDMNGEFALTVLEPRPGIVLLPQMLRLFNGTLCSLPYAHCHKVTRVDIRHYGDPVPLEADGEFLGHTPAHFEVVPGAISIPTI